ncbi:MAG: BTAD domain-containing putative transcriptional regulator [Longimicrobiales bacterium]
MQEKSLITLGRFELTRQDGTSISGPGHPLSMALLGILASKKTYRRDEILVLLWPESTERKARGALNQLLYRLRKEVGPDSILTPADSIAINRGEISCDIDLLKTAFAEKRYSEVLDRYVGDFLPGAQVPRSSEFDQWLSAERLAMQKLFLEACRRSASAAPDPEARIRTWERARAVLPLSEECYCEHINSLCMAGRHAQAHDEFDAFSALVRRELAIPPSQASKDYVEECLNQSAVVLAKLSAPLDDLSDAALIERGARTHASTSRRAVTGVVVCLGIIAAGIVLNRYVVSRANAETDFYPRISIVAGPGKDLDRVAEAIKARLIAAPGLWNNAPQAGGALRLQGIVTQIDSTRGVLTLVLSDGTMSVEHSGNFSITNLDSTIINAIQFATVRIKESQAVLNIGRTAPSANASNQLSHAAQVMWEGTRNWEAGAIEEARAAHARVVTRYPNWRLAASMRAANAHRWAWAALASGDRDSAKVIIDDALSISNTKQLLQSPSHSAEEDEAVGNLHADAARLDPGSARAHMDSAAALLRSAITKSSASPSAWALYSAVLFERGDDRGALVAAARARELAPEEARSSLELRRFLAAFNIEETRQAIESCTEIQKRDSGHWQAAYCELLLMASGDIEPSASKAANLIIRHTTLDPPLMQDQERLRLRAIAVAVGVREGSSTLADARSALDLLQSEATGDPEFVDFLLIAKSAIGEPVNAVSTRPGRAAAIARRLALQSERGRY